MPENVSSSEKYTKHVYLWFSLFFYVLHVCFLVLFFLHLIVHFMSLSFLLMLAKMT